MKIQNFFWKRTYLFVEYKCEEEARLFLIKENGKKYYFSNEKVDENKYVAKMNIAIIDGRNVLPAGEYKICSDRKICFEREVLENLENYNKVCRYDGIFAHIITFSLIKEDTNFNIKITVDFMKKNKHFSKLRMIDGFLEAKKSKQIKKILLILMKKMLNLYYRMMSFFPTNGKNILLMSETKSYIQGNLEALNNRLIERGLDNEYNISYSFRNIFNKKQNPLRWISVINKIARNDYIFLEDYVPVLGFLKLRKRTIIVQLWHAGFGFKLVGYGRFGIEGSPHPVLSCHRKYTYGIVSNEALREHYSEVWGIEPEAILATGLPRLEHFLDTDIIEKTKKKLYDEYPIFKAKTVITFAPTYRGSGQQEAHYDYDKIDFDKLVEFCKKTNSIVLFKNHHFITQEVPLLQKHKKYIYEMSNCELNDLFYITDVLVTDYSSCFCDFLLLNKPVMFFAYDKYIYFATRGMHRTLEEVAPGRIYTNFSDLLDALYSKNYEMEYTKDLLKDKCLTNKMLASDQIIDYVILKKEVEGICLK